MGRIERIDAYQVLDGRGDPTLEVVVGLAGGAEGSAIVPSGRSKGKHEALELRDGDQGVFGGKGVHRAASNVKGRIAQELVGLEGRSQAQLDSLLVELDGTRDFSNLGANAAVGVSMAFSRACAAEAAVPLYEYLNPPGPHELPMPMVSIIGGGLHADNPLEFQDFLVVPVGASSFSESIHMAWRVRTAAGEIVRQMGHPLLVGDGGGYAPPLRSNRLAAELVLRAIERAGYRPGEDLSLAFDMAANHFRRGEMYLVDGNPMPMDQYSALLKEWMAAFPIVSMEDPFDEEDVGSWSAFTGEVGAQVQLVGDDLFVTNPDRLASGVETHLANAILVKPNQIGTLTQTVRVIEQAKAANYGVVVSIRSGETEDAFISDLAVAFSAGQIKLGSLARSSRVAKFNQLLRIEHRMGKGATFAGRSRLRGSTLP
ncbi:MAG TPA: phosphopyruvate hydratase [Anaerolineales bacterium]|nr:phosphopyruvate hydratase [Anaerolineales bacterium]